MPRFQKLSRCSAIHNDASITSTFLPAFLAPSVRKSPSHRSRGVVSDRSYTKQRGGIDGPGIESLFYNTLLHLSRCRSHPLKRVSKLVRPVQCSTLVSKTPHNTAATESNEAVANRDNRQYGNIRPSFLQNLQGQPDPGGTNTAQSSQSMRRNDISNSFDPQAETFASQSRLPSNFFDDVNNLQRVMEDLETSDNPYSSFGSGYLKGQESKAKSLKEQLQLLDSVRILEEKLAQAKSNLRTASQSQARVVESSSTSSVILSKQDYLGLVDLYYYTQKNRFTPESPDSSPTPLLESHSFRLSEDFAPPQAYAEFYEDEIANSSPLKEIEEMIRLRQTREIAVMKIFVDTLLNETSTNRTLFEVYKRLPKPGVAYISKGMLRLFLQRMATPWAKSEKTMIRYLSLIDDMQTAGIPITQGEWSSAIHMAGRSFPKVIDSDVSSAFGVWRRMENEAGVRGSHVTFNILFDIAVRAGKFALAESVLKEMHDRGLRLNRLGRVNLIYYHGLRGDGDGIRRTYRDFVEAGEIVDTLVLNCVIASLLNAQEPSAAEQVYERMKDLQMRLKRGRRSDGFETLYMRYPPPGSVQIGTEMASAVLGRTLLRASRLKKLLPNHHLDLQNIMPLTPDYTTFRSMISYHANTSGNLDRLTVLMNEMTDLFKIPFTSINFQHLFKGFALHGPSSDPNSAWNVQRLDLVWDACRNGIKDSLRARRASRLGREPFIPMPSVSQLEEVYEQEKKNLTQQPEKLKRLSSWDDFVLDLAAFPRERRKPIERVHAQLFDDEPAETEAEQSEFSNPFFKKPTITKKSHPQQETYYPGGKYELDHEEGEYVLPRPELAIRPNLSTEPDDHNENDHDQEDDNQEDEDDEAVISVHEIRASRPLVCWLLRAYTRCTGSRAKVEEVWNSVRKLWRPHDPDERDSVLRVLGRCLRDCDRFGPPGNI